MVTEEMHSQSVKDVRSDITMSLRH